MQITEQPSLYDHLEKKSVREILEDINREDQKVASAVQKAIPQIEHLVKVGDIGISTTRLAQIGYAEINGKIVEVKSIDGFLNEKTPIIVSRITDGTIMVEKHKE